MRKQYLVYNISPFLQNSQLFIKCGYPLLQYRCMYYSYKHTNMHYYATCKCRDNHHIRIIYCTKSLNIILAFILLKGLLPAKATHSGFCLSAWATDITTTESNKEMAPSSYNLGVISVISASRSKVLNAGESDFKIFCLKMHLPQPWMSSKCTTDEQAKKSWKEKLCVSAISVYVKYLIIT